jgi:hypothetical protein
LYECQAEIRHHLIGNPSRGLISALLSDLTTSTVTNAARSTPVPGREADREARRGGPGPNDRRGRADRSDPVARVGRSGETPT